MWSRITDRLSCPVCNGHLSLEAFAEERAKISPDDQALAIACGIFDADFDRYIDSGLLVCSSCMTYFPVTHGLPVLVPYTTPIHNEFRVAFDDRLAKYEGYRFANSAPVPGEQFVMNSFSTEWIAYEYDGVIWDLSYEDHEKRLLSELGPDALEPGQHGTFLEIGCGIGLSTFFAAKNMECDGIGVDLSLAVLVATRHFRNNPFLHFIQASAFSIPLKKRSQMSSILMAYSITRTRPRKQSKRSACIAAIMDGCMSGCTDRVQRAVASRDV